MKRGIPTEYAGIRFRSRLEAQWAAFFDLLAWPWIYEPFDLSGYIPDFVLRTPTYDNATIVEVKPALCPDDFRMAANKIMGSGWTGSFVVVGADLLKRSEIRIHEDDGSEFKDIENCIGLGNLCSKREFAETRRKFPDEIFSEWCTPMVVEFYHCAACNRFYLLDGWPHCSWCGRNWEPGDRRGDYSIIRALWDTSKNRVQWKGKHCA